MTTIHTTLEHPPHLDHATAVRDERSLRVVMECPKRAEHIEIPLTREGVETLLKFENISWTRGHVDLDGAEAQALLAAWALFE